MAGTEIRTKKMKGEAEAYAEEDRLSNLPNHLIEMILERMPARDAAKTSIFSRNWRYIWVASPVLVFDSSFLEETFKKRVSFNDFEYVALISKILLQHRGLVQRFTLLVPKLNSDHSSYINDWIHFLSKNGIICLIICNWNNEPYRLSSYIYSCPDLVYFILYNFVMKPPTPIRSGRCFDKLRVLVLKRVKFEDNLQLHTLISNAPLLWELAIIDCTGIDDIIRIDTPTLRTLKVHYSSQYKSLEFKNAPNLYSVGYTLGSSVAVLPDHSKINGGFTELLRGMPRVSNLMIGGFVLKILGAGTVPTTIFKNLKKLHLDSIDLNQISCALCLLRSATNLMELVIRVWQTVDNPVSSFMEGGEVNLNLDQLQTLEFRFNEVSTSELVFVKLLLAHAKSLERIFVVYPRWMVADERSRIESEVMGFYRASTKAQFIIVLDPKGRRPRPFIMSLD